VTSATCSTRCLFDNKLFMLTSNSFDLYNYRPTLPPDSCLVITKGTLINSNITAQANCPSTTISEFLAVGPYGLKYSNLLSVPGSLSQSYINVNWDSISSVRDVTMICTIATDSNDLSSIISCITILINFVFPMPLNNTIAPTGTLQLNLQGKAISFRALFNLPMLRPNFQTFINIFYKNGKKLISFDCSDPTKVSYTTNGIIFKLQTANLQRSSYYITFDEGVGVIYNIKKTGCDLRSYSINSSAFWTFRIIKPISSICNFPNFMFLLVFYLFMFLCLHIATLVISTGVFLRRIESFENEKIYKRIHAEKALLFKK
jgi:hypothetical protein